MCVWGRGVLVLKVRFPLTVLKCQQWPSSTQLYTHNYASSVFLYYPWTNTTQHPPNLIAAV